MADNNADNDTDSYYKPLSRGMLLEWLNTFLHGIMGFATGEQRRNTPGTAAMPAREEPAAIPLAPLTPQRSMMGYINTGLYKIEQKRRQSRVLRQYSNALRTIRLTQRAIRQTPRRSRYLFAGYVNVLKDAKRRVKLLYVQLQQTKEHLRRYDPHALSDEIQSLERSMRGSTSPAGSMEIDLLLDSRRELLASVQGFDDRLNDLSSQIEMIAATLELNHMKVVGITASTQYLGTGESLVDRMREVTEQLSLLEQSLRELG
ncbi:MAG: hypothetical protein ABIR47_08055 [Candidatus Kapaibacterium sp.]